MSGSSSTTRIRSPVCADRSGVCFNPISLRSLCTHKRSLPTCKRMGAVLLQSCNAEAGVQQAHALPLHSPLRTPILALTYGTGPNRVRAMAFLVAAAVAAVFPSRVPAQDTIAAQLQCEGLNVTEIDIDANRPEFRGALAWWRKFARGLGLHH